MFEYGKAFSGSAVIFRRAGTAMAWCRDPAGNMFSILEQD